METIIRGFGLWSPLEWLLLALPRVAVVFVGYAPLIMVVLAALLIELRWLPLTKQYKGLWPGDLALGTGAGFILFGLLHYATGEVGPFWRSGLWNGITIGVMVLAVVPLAVVEYVSAIRNRHRPRPWTYSLYQLHTPTCLAHRLAMAITPYLIMKMCVPLFAMASIPLWLKLLAGAMFLVWAYCVYLDNASERPGDLGLIHPRRRAWFRLV